MADQSHQGEQYDAQEILGLLDDVRSRLRTSVWALHGMHQDIPALTIDDLADLEHMLTETIDHLLAPAYDAISQMLGATSSPGGTVITH